MNKKIISILIALAVIFNCFGVLAATFSDIEEHWAKAEIEALTEKKIINGYDDQTFGPEDSVIRADALLLASRTIGSIDVERADYLEASNEKYYSNLMALGYTGYEKTLSFLIYNDLYTYEELRDFLNNKQGDKPLKRVEAAEILVKILNKTEEANKMKSKLDFKDADDIASSKKGFVAYCQQEGLMKGMEDNKFCPDQPVTRAQMATILYRILNTVETVYSQGVVTEVNSVNDTLKYVENDGTKKTIQSMKNFKKKSDAETITTIDTIKIGDKINVVFKNDAINIIEFLSDTNNETISGEYEGAIVSKTEQKIKVKSETDGISHTYVLDSKCKVTINGKAGNVSDLTSGDYITITLTADVVTNINSENYHETISGFISKIIISSSPTFTVTANDKTYEYDFVNKDANITLDGVKADIYDLRLGYSVEVTLFNSKVTNVKIMPNVIEEVTDYVSGTIKYVDTTFNYILLEDIKGEEKQIFFNSETAIYDTNNNDRELSSDLIGTTIKTLYTSNNYTLVADEIVIVIINE